MPHYRIYSLDSAGHIVSGFDHTMFSDAEAIAVAYTMFKPRQLFEIWQGTRQVWAIAPRPDGSAPPGPTIGPRKTPDRSDLA
jgi:hypothetical protein